MDPSEAIALTNSFIDPGLGGNGTLVTFTRITDARTSPPTMIIAPCFGVVRNYRPQDIVAGTNLEQGDSNIAIEANALPALAQALGSPPRVTDRVSYNGYQRNVVGVDVLMIAGQVIRTNVQVRG